MTLGEVPASSEIEVSISGQIWSASGSTVTVRWPPTTGPTGGVFNVTVQDQDTSKWTVRPPFCPCFLSSFFTPLDYLLRFYARVWAFLWARLAQAPYWA